MPVAIRQARGLRVDEVPFLGSADRIFEAVGC